MLRRLFIGVAVALAATSLAVSGPLGARAAVNGAPSDAIAFVGVATITGDGQANCGPGGVANAGEGDVPAAVDLNGGCGSFSFQSLACVGASDEPTLETPLPLEVDTCTINPATGTFINQMCGTGSATGNATVNSDHGLGDNLNIAFSIAFTGGVGLLTATNITGTSPDGAGIPPAQVNDGSETGTGVVLLLPPIDATNIANTVNHSVLGVGRGEDCVTGFGIVGAAVAIEGPNS